MWINRDAFQRAGLDPDRPPADVGRCGRRRTHPEIQGRRRKAADTASPSWIHFEMFSAIHDFPFATGGNGFDRLNIELKINSAAHVKHLQRLPTCTRTGCSG